MSMVSAIFAKEMLTLARSRRFYLLRAFVLAGPLLGMWIAWDENVISGSVFQDLSVTGHTLYTVYSGMEWLFLAIVVPLLVSSVIVTERENGTLGLLLATNMMPRSIVMDKVLARLCFAALLVFSGFPLFLVIILFGGTSLLQVAVFHVAAVSTAVLCASFGIVASTRAATAMRAMAGTFILMLRYLGLVVLIWIGASVMSFILICFLSITAFMVPSYGGIINELGQHLFYMPFLIMLPISAFVSEPWLMVFSCISFALVAFWRFRSAIRHSAENLHSLRYEGMRFVYNLKEFDGLFNWLNSKGRRYRASSSRKSVAGHTTLDRDLRVPFIGDRMKGILISFLIMMGLMLLNTGVSVGGVLFVSTAQMVILSLAIIPLAATAFSLDKEKHTIEVLLSTPINRNHLVLGRFMRIAKILVVYVFPPQLLLFLGIPGRPVYYDAEWVIVWPLALLGMTVFLEAGIVMGMLWSAAARTRGIALIGTAFTMLAWYYLPLFRFGATGLLPASVFDLAALLSPLSWLSEVYSIDGIAAPWLVGALALPALFTVCGMVLMMLRFDRLMLRE